MPEGMGQWVSFGLASNSSLLPKEKARRFTGHISADSKKPMFIKYYIVAALSTFV